MVRTRCIGHLSFIGSLMFATMRMAHWFRAHFASIRATSSGRQTMSQNSQSHGGSSGSYRKALLWMCTSFLLGGTFSFAGSTAMTRAPRASRR